ncbi:MAG TPA: hypothetical protein VG013_17445 [Gemmataceae bacterium]|jgi:hypothetical protein|nr:hypothetical protein [Gemmataceae bacterium]
MIKALKPVLVVVALLGVVGVASFAWQSGLSPWTSGNGNMASPAGRRLNEGVDDRVPMVALRCQRRQYLARDVAEDRCTLLAAAARFHDLSESGPDFYWEAFRMRYPGASDDERFCRQVIAFVDNDGALPSVQREAAVARLEGELAEHLKSGRLRLPVVPPMPFVAGVRGARRCVKPVLRPGFPRVVPP